MPEAAAITLDFSDQVAALEPVAPIEAAPAGIWQASLELAYALEDGRTVPVARRHKGPLRVQKGFRPEGPDLWHQVIVHPPGGIAAGDRLAISVRAAAGAKALLTSPGAAKWYRCDRTHAEQTIDIDVGPNASIEWLPMETIFFSGTDARLRMRFALDEAASLIATDLYCLGRPASGEVFSQGSVRISIEVRIGGRLSFVERARIGGGERVMQSVAGLGGFPLFGSLLAVSPQLDDDAVEQCRALACAGEIGVTRLDRIVLVRWRGHRSDDGLNALRSAWSLLRPRMLGRVACPPRVWST
jgi:urease accessory protein